MQKKQFEVTDFKNAEGFFKATGLRGVDAVEFLLKELKKAKGER